MLELVFEKFCVLYEVERLYEVYVGKIVNDVIELGNFGVLVD